MTATAKSNIAKKKSTASHSQLKNKQGISSKFAFRKSDWILIPLSLMVIVCLAIVIMKAHVLTYVLTPELFNIFWFPPFPALLVALFGIVYIYKTLKRKFINNITTGIAYLLLIIFTIFMFQIATIVGGKGYLCAGLLGTLTDCSQINALTLYEFFGNPYSLTSLSALAIAGGVSLMLKKQ